MADLLEQGLAEVLSDAPIEEGFDQTYGSQMKAAGYQTWGQLVEDLNLLAQKEQLTQKQQWSDALQSQFNRALQLDWLKRYLLSLTMEEHSAFLDQIAQMKTRVKSLIEVDLSDMADERCQKLIQELVRYQHFLEQCRQNDPLIENCLQMQQSEGSKIDEALEAFKPAKGFFKYLFASKERKQKANEAHAFLESLLSGDYGNKSEDLLKIFEEDRCSDEEALALYQQTPDIYSDLLEKTVRAAEIPVRVGRNAHRFSKQLSEDSQRVIAEHWSLIGALVKNQNIVECCEDEIKAFSKELFEAKVNALLQKSSIDELDWPQQRNLKNCLSAHGCRSLLDAISLTEKQLAAFAVRDIGQLVRQRESLLARINERMKIDLHRDQSLSQCAQLLSAVSRYRQARLWSEPCNQFLRQYQTLLEQAFKDADPLKNAYRWCMTPEPEKQKALETHRRLTSLLTDEYGQKVKALLQEFAQITQQSNQSGIQDFKANETEFRGIIEELCPGLLGDCDDSHQLSADQVNQLIEEHRERLEELRQIRNAQATQYQSEVISAAKELADQETIEKLKDVPLFEFGPQETLLKGMRFSNAAEVFLAITRGNIRFKASDYRKISQRTDELFRQFRQKMKIRLSADHQNTASTALVTAVWKYKQQAACAEESAAILEQYEAPVAQNIGCLKPATSELKWFLASAEERDIARSAYRWLRPLTREEYGQRSLQTIRDSEEVEGITGQEAWYAFNRDPIPFFKILEDLVPDLLGSDKSIYGLPDELAREIESEPLDLNGLRCSLRKYQEWGVKYILHQKCVLLGDEMGLGKTVQAIAAMVSLRNQGATHFLVACPLSVLINWCREIERHSNLTAIKVHGIERSDGLRRWFREGGVAVTNYQNLNYFVQLVVSQPRFHFAMLVVDEAHSVKNRSAKRTQCTELVGQYTDRRLFMTGTALENRAGEMLSLISMLQPEIAKKASGLTSWSQASQFCYAIAPVYYRRKREDVLTELPELIENQEWCELEPEEEEVYEQTVLYGTHMAVRQLSWNVNDLRKSSKASRLKEIVEEAKSEGRKVLVFSFFLETLRKVASLFGHQCLDLINGSVSAQRRQAIIDQFDQSPAGTVLAAQIDAGGYGLNIQAASVVVICEPQYKPSTEMQAISRAYRMGQARNVLVHRLLCKGTIDERLTELLAQKQAEFNAFADRSVAAEQVRNIDEKQFGRLMNEEQERIRAKHAAGGNSGKPAAEKVVWEETGDETQKIERIDCSPIAPKRALGFEGDENHARDEASLVESPQQIRSKIDALLEFKKP